MLCKRWLCCKKHIETWMILKIVTHTRYMRDHTNIKRPELICWPDAGEEEGLWGIENPTGENDFFLHSFLLLFAIFQIRDANCTCPLEKHSCHQGIHPDDQIGAILCRMEVAISCARPLPMVDCGLVKAEASL